jgi:hypothetical protein
MPVGKIGAVFKPAGWLRAQLLRGSRAAPLPVPALPEGISALELTAHRAAWTDEWLRRRKARLQAGFAELPASVQQALLDSFRDELLRSAQTQVLKRFDLSGWQHRMVIAVFLRFYGVSALGEQWDKPGIDDILAIAAEFASSGAGSGRSEF